MQQPLPTTRAHLHGKSECSERESAYAVAPCGNGKAQRRDAHACAWVRGDEPRIGTCMRVRAHTEAAGCESAPRCCLWNFGANNLNNATRKANGAPANRESRSDVRSCLGSSLPRASTEKSMPCIMFKRLSSPAASSASKGSRSL